MKTTPKGPFLGINNRRDRFELHVPKEGDYLGYDTINVEVTKSGKLRRRAGADLIQPMTGAHSLFKNYFVRDGVLFSCTLPGYSETIVKILSVDDRVDYEDYAGSIYFTNGTDSGRILPDGTVLPWALPSLSEPDVMAIPGGLFPGYYQVALAYYNAVTGEEGGVSPSNNFLLEANSALRISLPGAVAGATHINVYVTTVDGSVPTLQASVPVSQATFDVTEIGMGREAMQRFEQPLPAGTRLFEFNGRLCSVKGSVLYIGLPHRPGYYDPVAGWIAFQEDISIVAPNQAGVYVAADKTFWLQGQDLGDVQVFMDVLPYGAVPGTEFKHPNKTQVGWFGKNGLVLASPQGEVEAVMSDNIEQSPPESGISMVFEDSFRRVVSCGWCVNLENLAVTRFTEYDFSSAHGGYGTKSDGIYLLSGSSDVPYNIDLGEESFGSESIKYMPAVYLGVEASEPMKVRVKTPEHDCTYAGETQRTELAVQRITPGRGLRANWFDLSIVGDTGAMFKLASVSFAPIGSQRRVR